MSIRDLLLKDIAKKRWENKAFEISNAPALTAEALEKIVKNLKAYEPMELVSYAEFQKRQKEAEDKE